MLAASAANTRLSKACEAAATFRLLTGLQLTQNTNRSKIRTARHCGTRIMVIPQSSKLKPGVRFPCTALSSYCFEARCFKAGGGREVLSVSACHEVAMANRTAAFAMALAPTPTALQFYCRLAMQRSLNSRSIRSQLPFFLGSKRDLQRKPIPFGNSLCIIRL